MFNNLTSSMMAPSGPTRRNGAPSSESVSQPTQSMSATSTTHGSSFSPIIPTSFERVLLSLYPATLLLGSLFSLLEPHARNAPYSTVLQSHPPEQAPSYFALKRNLINLYFVKINWFWLTGSYLLFLFLHRVNGPPGLVFTPRKLRGLVRYGVVTSLWFFVTQWFFGPALIDRGFKITGGACELASQYEGSGGKTELVTAKACKAVGGAWKGGHDISGHVFILVLSSAFLAMEVLPVLMGNTGPRDERIVMRRDGKTGRVEEDFVDSGLDEEEGMLDRIAVWTPVVVGGLSWWMLLMTAAYFHTWFEKFTGLLVAFSALFTVFLLPRAIPAMRDLVGLPGA